MSLLGREPRGGESREPRVKELQEVEKAPNFRVETQRPAGVSQRVICVVVTLR